MAAERRFRVDPPDGAPLVAEALCAAGWLPAEDDGEWTLLWSVDQPSAATYARLADGSFVNHLPGIVALTRKDALARTLARAGVDAVPETLLMPEDLGTFRARAAASPELTWIQKPRAGARGEGISILAGPDEAETGGNWLVQRYLDRPHLVHGRKYTLRRYVLVTALDPLTVWIFDDGFTKLASRPFAVDGAARLDRFRHLTNPGVQAENPELATSADNLTQAAYTELLDAEGVDSATLLEQIDDLVAVTVAAARDELARETWSATNNPAGCFELLGLDLLVDADLRPWLLECNLSPSLSVEADGEQTRASREELELKRALVADTLHVLGLADGPPTRFRRLLPNAGRGALLPLPRPGEGPLPGLAPAPGIAVFPLEEGVALHDSEAGRAHVLDAVGAYVWAAFAEGLGAPEIAAELGAALPESAWRAEADVRNALGEWFERGLAVERVTARVVEPVPTVAPRPWTRWNRGGVYRCFDTTLGVTVPDGEAARWLDVSVGALADPEAGEVDVALEIVASPSGFEVLTPDERFAFRERRQLGSAVRRLLLDRACAGAGFRASLVADSAGRVALLIGAEAVRARVARAIERDGGRCAGDALARLAGGASVEGLVAGVEVPAGTTWWGDLPGLDDPEPLLLAADGGFARMWRPVGGAETLTPHVLLRLDIPASEGALLAATPLAEADALRELLAARPDAAPLAAAAAGAAVDLVQSVACYRVLVPDPDAGLGVLSVVP